NLVCGGELHDCGDFVARARSEQQSRRTAEAPEIVSGGGSHLRIGAHRLRSGQHMGKLFDDSSVHIRLLFLMLWGPGSSLLINTVATLQRSRRDHSAARTVWMSS